MRDEAVGLIFGYSSEKHIVSLLMADRSHGLSLFLKPEENLMRTDQMRNCTFSFFNEVAKTR